METALEIFTMHVLTFFGFINIHVKKEVTLIISDSISEKYYQLPLPAKIK